MLHQVNNNAITNVPTQGAHHRHAAGTAGAGADNATPPTPNPEPAAILDVSAEGRELAALRPFQVYVYDSDTNPFKLDKAFFTEDAKQQRWAEYAERLSEEKIIERHTVSPEWTLNRLVEDVVNSKMDATTANRFTSELERLIRGFDWEKGGLIGTVEERTVNREKGLQLAEYIAETYIDDPTERKNFLDGVKGFYDNAVLRDKGYDVLEGPDGVTVVKPGSGSDDPVFDKAWKEAYTSLSKTTLAGLNWGVDSKTMLAALIDETAKILLRDAPAGKYDSIAEKYAAGEITGANVINQLRKARFDEARLTGKPISDTTAVDKSFAENEKIVGDTIERVKKSLDMDAIREDVQRMIKDILSTFMSYDDYAESIRYKPPTETIGKIAGHLV